jgi:N-acetylglucosaminyldiphosphoundecaprenol N-acetyl-beta-D-mannosaminyltransferase
MTAPKQEKWAHQNRAQLNTKMICCIGAVFDFYACTTKRPSKVWINLGFEWLGRLISEPKRLWKRYLYFGPIFLWHITKTKIYSTKVLS